MLRHLQSLYYVLALKKIARREDWDREIEAHRAFSALETEGIVKCLGSWEAHTDTVTEYYLVMEYGLADLNQFFRSCNPPSFAQEVFDFWTSMSRVIPALSHMHNLRTSSTISTCVQYYG